MARLNTKTAPQVTTFEGGKGFIHTPKQELFITAISTLNENTFYESASDREDRIGHLVGAVADDGEWLENFVTWLRKEAGLRTVAVMIAAIAVHTRLGRGLYGHNRAIVRASLGRLDDNTEFLGYWINAFGRKVPSAVKRGISDSLAKGLNEDSYLKWRGKGNRGAVSLRDVLNIVHPVPKDQDQAKLYKLVIDEAYGNEKALEGLDTLAFREGVNLTDKDVIAEVLADPDRGPKVIKGAGLTHESVAGLIGKIPAEVWDNLIPFMGYKALRMNLRRIDESGISDKTRRVILKRLRDPEEIRKSNPMPIEFLAAVRNAPPAYAPALSEAAGIALENVPRLTGRTLVMVDVSGSMGMTMSERGSLTRVDAARVFGAALALRGEDVTLVAYATENAEIFLTTTDLLVAAEQIPNFRSGTDSHSALDAHYDGHDRVINITDEQSYSYYRSRHGLFDNIPDNVPTFTWNLGGYRVGDSEIKAGRFTFGGLSDKAFDMVPLLEAGLEQGWPWD